MPYEMDSYYLLYLGISSKKIFSTTEELHGGLIRGEGFIPRPSGAVIRYETRDQYLMRTTYPAALR